MSANNYAFRPTRKGLTLDRKIGEEIVYTLPHGPEIVVTVTAVRGGRVKIHSHAPADVAVRRGELPLKLAS